MGDSKSTSVEATTARDSVTYSFSLLATAVMAPFLFLLLLSCVSAGKRGSASSSRDHSEFDPFAEMSDNAEELSY